MRNCEVCQNEYRNTFEVIMRGRSHIFDSFECAIHALAPRCRHCGCRVVGHGVEADGIAFCCAHCARQEGYQSMKDQLSISFLE
ncbi:MAG: hypothetical protein HOE90_10025 [Bacteriovoracaceae bacterium]|nr:hypothetical protein [Bacteriovoracaceae bacterium]